MPPPPTCLCTPSSVSHGVHVKLSVVISSREVVATVLATLLLQVKTIRTDAIIVPRECLPLDWEQLHWVREPNLTQGQQSSNAGAHVNEMPQKQASRQSMVTPYSAARGM